MRQILAIILTSLLVGCAGPQFLYYPLDPGGRSLNSPFTESDPYIAGRYIVFASSRRNRQDIYLFDGVEQRLIELPGLNALDAIASDPSVSEDGNTLVFLANRQGKSDIYLYNRQTRQLRNLTQNLAAEVRNPTLSANGQRIAFESAQKGQWDLKVLDRRGESILEEFN